MLKSLLLLFPALLCAQGVPSFEVATIKPNDAVKNAGVTSGFQPSHNGLRATGTLQTFIRFAYGVDDVQIVGGPPWLNREMYEINAKATTEVSLADLKPMLQELLIERFKLSTHPDTRQLPVFSLVLAKGGSKLQRPDDNKPTTSSGPTLLRGTMDSATIAARLTSTLRRTVIDNTGLQGIWKFKLTWAADDVTTGPSLFTAIQEQLGLKLESTKGPVQVLVIDNADRPSDN